MPFERIPVAPGKVPERVLLSEYGEFKVGDRVKIDPESEGFPKFYLHGVSIPRAGDIIYGTVVAREIFNDQENPYANGVVPVQVDGSSDNYVDNFMSKDLTKV